MLTFLIQAIELVHQTFKRFKQNNYMIDYYKSYKNCYELHMLFSKFNKSASTNKFPLSNVTQCGIHEIEKKIALTLFPWTSGLTRRCIWVNQNENLKKKFGARNFFFKSAQKWRFWAKKLQFCWCFCQFCNNARFNARSGFNARPNFPMPGASQ